MDTSKIITGVVSARGYTVTAPIVKEDYGLYLKIEGVELPSTYQVDFSNSENNGTSVTMIGNSDGVLIPSQFIKSGKDVFAFLYHVGADYGRTVYKFRIPNKVRPDRTNEEPTPEEQSVIDQCISALNEAVAQTAQDVESADQSAQSASDDADRAERAKTSSETAQGKAEEAQESAERAKDDAETSERNASESERKAKGYADTASEKADSIIGLTATATTLPDGSSATASYNAETGVMSFGIPKGKDGTDGDDGYSPTASVIKSGKVATITITDKNGTTSAQVEDGEDGTDGIDGISPSVSVTDITGGHRVVITDKDGAKSFDVEDGATGATPNFTIGTVETLEPTESATATITGTPENPVLNLGIPQGEQGEVTLADLNTALMDKADIITDTASGSIASFTDGADNLPLKSLVVDINPVQDLHGQENPYPAGGGANKWDEQWETGWIGWSGQNADNPDRIRSKGFIPVSEGSVYRVVTSNNLQFFYYDSNKSFVSYESSSRADQSTITIPTGCAYIRFYTYGTSYGGTYKNDIAINYPATVTTYSPYENLCPISGWTEVGVEQRGSNLWDGLGYTSGSYLNVTGGTNSNSPYAYTDYIPVAPNSTYYVNGISGNNPSICWYDKNKNFVGAEKNGGATSKTIFVPPNAHFIRVSLLLDSVNSLYVNYPSADHDYHPYTGRSITINLGQTVYGGKLDVLSGVLTVDRAMVDIGAQSWTYTAVQLWFYNYRLGVKSNTRNAISSMYAYKSTPDIVSDLALDNVFTVNNTSVCIRNLAYTDVTAFKAAMSGVQFCYELAEPITIQLTPNQVNSLLGVNNLWADSGDTTAEYRADTKLYIAKKIAEAISALS